MRERLQSQEDLYAMLKKLIMPVENSIFFTRRKEGTHYG